MITGQDKFGKPYVAAYCKPLAQGGCKGYIELGGRLYKLFITNSKKEQGAIWVTATAARRSGGSNVSAGGYNRL